MVGLFARGLLARGLLTGGLFPASELPCAGDSFLRRGGILKWRGVNFLGVLEDSSKYLIFVA